MYKRIKELRENSSKSQTEIAEVLKTTQQYYSEYEKGKRVIPPERLVILAEFYNTSVDYILEITNEKKPYQRAKKMTL